MDYKIINVEVENYSMFDDMIYWRINQLENLMDTDIFT